MDDSQEALREAISNAPLGSQEYMGTFFPFSLFMAFSIRPYKGSLEEVEKASLINWLDVKGFNRNEVAERLGMSTKEVKELERRIPIPFPTMRNNFADIETSRLTRYLGGVVESTERFSPQIMMGTTPSGPLHLANMFTFANGMSITSRALQDVGLEGRCQLAINDFTVDESQFPYVAERVEAIEEFAQYLSKHYEVPIEVQCFSDLQRTDDFRKGLRQAANKGLFGRELDLSIVSDGEYVHIPARKANEMLFTDDTQDYALGDLFQTIAMRSSVARPDIYVIGGDHAHGHQIVNLFEEDGNMPYTIRTGVLYAPDGEQMHASDGNTISWQELKETPGLIEKLERLGKNYVGNVGPAEYVDLLPDSVTHLYGQPRITVGKSTNSEILTGSESRGMKYWFRKITGDQ